MPTQTEFAKLYMYDNSPQDASELFLTFRTNICGTGTDSNMQKIDSYLKKYNTSINSAAIYNATCSFATSQYTLILSDSVSTPTANLFSLRFISSKDFVEGETFLFDGTTYNPVNADFKSGELLLVNFDKENQKCYFGASQPLKSAYAGNGVELGGILADSTTESDSIVCKTKEDNKLYINNSDLNLWIEEKKYTNEDYVNTAIESLNRKINDIETLIGESISALSGLVDVEGGDE